MLNQRASQILWELPDPLMALNSAFKVEYVNSAFEEMLGILLSQIRGIDIHEAGLEVENDWEDLIQNLKSYSNGKWGSPKKLSPEDNRAKELLSDPLMPKNSFGPYQSRPKITLKEKIYFYEIFKVLDPQEFGPLSVVLFREITKDIAINDQMVQAEKMSGLGTLAAGLAHELNNPLYTIIGFSEMIPKKNDKTEIDSIAKGIGERAKQLAAILENLNSYIQSNPTDGYMTININERLDAALEIALLTHESKRISINKNYSPLLFLKAKSDEIQQVFFNIFANSIQAMNGSGSIKIRSTSGDKGIIVTIQDTGEGVPREYIAKVFDPFFTTKDQGEGTGLGLTAAYQLVKKYGGRIEFNSVQGEGTTVVIYWPVENGTAL